MMNARKRLRELISARRYVIAPGAHDALTARLVQAAGFDAVYLTGGGYSRANAFPDLGLLTMTENLQFIARTVDAVEIPVIADMDNGYGNALNVVRAVREFEKAGVAAFHIEDQSSPKKCGNYDGKQMISTAEMVGKIKAAVDTRRDADMIVIARTDSLAAEGLGAATDRVNAYLDAGADMGFIEALQSREEFAAIPKALSKPAMANIIEGARAMRACELEEMGFRLGIYASQAHRAAIAAAKRLFAALKRDGDTSAIDHELATFNEREEALDTKHWRAIERNYLEGA